MHLPATSSSWAISDTANKSVSFATGMLAAATSDDINPIALVTCDNFGALLPVSIETRLKIEQLARRSYTSHVFTYIKAQVGYRKNDSVEQLSRSDSGTRFLCLAATLSTLDHYDAAARLDALLEATQKDQQIRPTVRQLQVMMASLNTKLALSDFGNSVAGFETSLRPQLQNDFAIVAANIPSKTSFQSLVLALNRIGRVGESDVDALEIKLRSSYTPWTCAFVKWLLGQPPQVRTETGAVLFDAKESPVTLTITKPIQSRKRRLDDTEFELATIQNIPRLREIVFQDDNKQAWEGLVNVTTWFRHRIMIFQDRFPELQRDQMKDAVSQALNFIVKDLPNRLLLCDDYHTLRHSLEKLDHKPEDLFHSAAPVPFPESALRLQLARELLGDHFKLSDGKQLQILLPQNLAKEVSGCAHCSNPGNRILAGTIPCRVEEFLSTIGDIGAMLITLSLFGQTIDTMPMVRAGTLYHTSRFHHRLYPYKKVPAITCVSWSKLVTTGWQALLHGKCSVLSCPPISLFKFAAQMMGHKKIWDSTIVSSNAGQVLFPAFFEANEFVPQGYLQLCAFPGKLRRENMEFDFLIDAESDRLNEDVISDADTEEHDSDQGMSAEMEEPALSESAEGPVLGESAEDTADVASSVSDDDMPISNEEEEQVSSLGDEEDLVRERGMETMRISRDHRAFDPMSETFIAKRTKHPTPSSVMTWKISVQDNLLRGELSLQDSEQPVMAWTLIDSLGRCRLANSCRHRVDQAAGDLAQQFLISQGPVSLRHPEEPRVFFDVERSYAAQLTGLEIQDHFPPTVVHINGCVRCALQLAIDCNSRVVIS